MIVPMTPEYARQISGWTYPGEYAVYSFSGNAGAISELMNGEYYACLDSDHSVTGFFCFGQSARIPAVEEVAYAADALDMGLGMKPDLCGQGNGNAFVSAGLEFAQKQFMPGRLRLSVASFNIRAIRTYGKLGFRHVNNIIHRHSCKLFHVMVYDGKLA